MATRSPVRLGIWYRAVNYHRKRLVFGISILSQPDNNYVDHANTLKQDSFWLFGLNMSYQLSSRVRLYANINNVADQTYTAAYVVRDQSSELMPTYLPGNGPKYECWCGIQLVGGSIQRDVRPGGL